MFFASFFSRWASARPAGHPGPAPLAAPALPARRHWLQRLGVVLGAGLLARPAAAVAPLDVASAYQPLLGEIFLAAYNFAPKGFALCAGQHLPINQNQALFSLLGTMYGGNGQTTFALPDLRGRTPMGVNNLTQGTQAGGASQPLTLAQLPAHAHLLPANSAPGTSSSPLGVATPGAATGVDIYGRPLQDLKLYAPGSGVGAGPGTAPETVSNAGGNQAAANVPPYLGLNYFIALQGAFPSQN